MDEKILNYQKLDAKLVKLERELAGDESKKIVSNMIASVKSSQNKLLAYEKEAEEEIAEFNDLKKEYTVCVKALEDLLKVKVATMEEKNVKDLADKINQTSNKLSILERKINTFSDKANNILKNSEAIKKSIVAGKQKYKESKELYEKKVAALTPEMEKIKKELVVLEKSVDKDLLAKYKHLKQDNIFPVFVPATLNSCGGCRMEIPHAHMQNIKDKGFIECEQCRRIIYIL